MKRNHTLLAFCGSIILGTVLIYGCGDDDTSNPSTNTSSSSGSTGDGGKTSSSSSGSSGTDASSSSSSGDTGTPDSGTKPPTLGAQIDRFGRPAINTAGNNTFEPDASTAGSEKDKYNADGNKAGWVAAYRDRIAANLAIYDSLDQQCGNQPFADASAANTTATSRYGTLAGVLADDRLWMNTGGTSAGLGANEYLAVELNATGALTNNLVGGRRLTFDVIDRTYGVVAGFDALGNGFPDNIAKVPAKTDGTTFPYLAAP